jgi:hypothetical protein
MHPERASQGRSDGSASFLIPRIHGAMKHPEWRKRAAKAMHTTPGRTITDDPYEQTQKAPIDRESSLSRSQPFVGCKFGGIACVFNLPSTTKQTQFLVSVSSFVTEKQF